MAGVRWTVNIDEIPEEGQDVRFSALPSFFEFDLEEGAWRGPVEWTGTLQRFDADVLCRGKAKARVTLPCARCLREVGVDLLVDTVFTFVPARPAEADEGVEVEVGSEEPDMYLYRDGRLDLRDAVRDHLLLAAPLQPFCRADCQGLCPKCGADLNEGPCGCAQEAADPRWEALARLKGAIPSKES